MATAAAALRVNPPVEGSPGRLDVPRLALRFLLMAACLVGIGISLDPLLAILLVAVGLLPWLWREPVRGVYLLMAAAVMIEIYKLNFSDSLTDRVPFFLNLNNTSGADVPITPAEILMLVIAGVTMVKAASERSLGLWKGNLFWPYAVFIAVVLMAEFHGLLSGGDFKVSLWELRPMAYSFILFLLAGTLIQTRRQLVTLFVIFILAIGVKILIADYRYLITLGRDVTGRPTVLGHEDSYFIDMFLIALLMAWAWGLRSRLFIWTAVIGTPLAILALLANQRRVGAYALVAAIASLLVVAYVLEPHMRKPLLAFGVVLVIGLGGFIGASWNVNYGLRGELVRPVRSLVDPTVRDFQSDTYRTSENADLKLSFQSDPIIGMGFGKPFLTVFPLADISQIYPLWNVIPHNTLMWVGVRTGAIGFAAFWALIGMVLLHAFFIARTRRDPLVRAAAVFAIAAVVAELVVAYGDLQLENERNMVFFGIVLGVLNRLSAIPDAATAEGVSAEADRPSLQVFAA
jgi:hypothetical protein